MSATVNLHRVNKVTAGSGGSATWLSFETDDHDCVSIFMPLAVAQAMAEAWNVANQGTHYDRVTEVAE